MIKRTTIKIIFVPGSGGGSVYDHWFPYVQQHLTRYGIEVVAKEFPDPVIARSQYWLPYIKNVLKADNKSILIGYSTGATACLRYAEQNKIFGSILVAPSCRHYDDEHEKASGYFDNIWNWEKIKNNQRWIVQFSSEDDPYIPIDESQYINQMLDSEYFECTDQGHFGDDVFKEKFPEIVEIVRNKLGV
jgi:uncharacterized protein